jgi:hypothetical protein
MRPIVIVIIADLVVWRNANFSELGIAKKFHANQISKHRQLRMTSTTYLGIQLLIPMLLYLACSGKGWGGNPRSPNERVVRHERELELMRSRWRGREKGT